MADEGPLGWIVTGAYFVAAIVALIAARRAELRAFSIVCALVSIALGANKQLDLQTHVIALGRRATFALGLYEHRDLLHVLFPILVGAALLVALAIAVHLYWPHRRAIAPVIAGFALLAIFVVLRVALFSHLERVLGWTWLESGLSSILELLAIAVIAIGLAVSARPGSSRGRS